MALDPITLLDQVLAILADDNPPSTLIDIFDKYFRLYGISIDEDEHFGELLEKLEQDGHINSQLYSNNTERHYRVTFNGRYFLFKGAYHQKNHQERAERSQKALWAHLASYGSMGAALFAGLYLAWLVYTFWLEHCHRLYW